MITGSSNGLLTAGTKPLPKSIFNLYPWWGTWQSHDGTFTGNGQKINLRHVQGNDYLNTLGPSDAIWNYVNPVCCVATVCHQVRCMHWGHLGHFHRAISHLKSYKIVCMRYLACTFSHMKSIDKFSMFLQSGVSRHFLWRFIAVWIEPHCVHVYVCQCRHQTLAAICRTMGIWDVFMLHLPGKIYLGFVSLDILVDTRSGNGLEPGGTKPLFESMLIYHQQSINSRVMFSLVYLNTKYINLQVEFGIHILEITAPSRREKWVNS